jgi:hypothetical protein
MKPVLPLRDFIIEMDVFTDSFHAYLNKRTGELVTIRDEEIDILERGLDASDEIDLIGSPDWQRDVLEKTREVLTSQDYLPLPTKFDIHEYSIMERFCLSLEDDQQKDELIYAIRGSGAFRRFKEAIHRLGISDDWYLFRDAALEAIAIDWLEEHRIEYIRDTAVE